MARHPHAWDKGCKQSAVVAQRRQKAEIHRDGLSFSASPALRRSVAPQRLCVRAPSLELCPTLCPRTSSSCILCELANLCFPQMRIHLET